MIKLLIVVLRYAMLISGSTDEKKSLLFPSVEWYMIALMASPCSDISNDEGGDIGAFLLGRPWERNMCWGVRYGSRNATFILQRWGWSRTSCFCSRYMKHLKRQDGKWRWFFVVIITGSLDLGKAQAWLTPRIDAKTSCSEYWENLLCKRLLNVDR